MRAGVLGLAVALVCTAAFAQGASPDERSAACDRFDWSLKREQAWFAAPNVPRVASGGTLPADAPAAVLALKPTGEAALPGEPTRPSKPGTYSGVVNVGAPKTDAVYQITLSDEGWIDVVQDGDDALRPVAHTGKRDCAGLRKSLRFQLAAKPFAVTISNATSETIGLAVTPVP